MRPMLYLLMAFIAVTFFSCQTFYDVFVRNMTNGPVTLDVYLLDKTDMKTLPNKARVADRIVRFKTGYKKYFERYKNVTWVDTSHFKFTVDPHTTVDLSDMTGIFRNGSSMRNVLITLTTNTRMDTLVNGRTFPHKDFEHKARIFSNSMLYYDVK